MHFKSLLHVRDHVKVQGRPYDLLMYIALHTNRHTGEAFELTIERQAHRHQITPEWTRILLNGVIATGELLVERSRWRHPNRYRFPLERCQACQASNPEVELGVDFNPKVTPAEPPSEPQSETAPTPKCDPANPKVGGVSEPQPAQLEPLKEVKDFKEKKEGPTPKLRDVRDEGQPPMILAPFSEVGPWTMVPRLGPIHPLEGHDGPDHV
jgi:hypothetical protein